MLRSMDTWQRLLLIGLSSIFPQSSKPMLHKDGSGEINITRQGHDSELSTGMKLHRQLKQSFPGRIGPCASTSYVATYIHLRPLPRVFLSMLQSRSYDKESACNILSIHKLPSTNLWHFIESILYAVNSSNTISKDSSFPTRIRIPARISVEEA